MTPAELAEKLERLDALFVDLYNYAEVERDKIRAGEGNAVHALNSIRHTIGGRYNVIPQAAARLRSLEERLVKMEWHMSRIAIRTEFFDPGSPPDVIHQEARAALQGEGQ